MRGPERSEGKTCVPNDLLDVQTEKFENVAAAAAEVCNRPG